MGNYCSMRKSMSSEKEFANDAERRAAMKARFEEMGAKKGFWPPETSGVQHITSREIKSLPKGSYVLIDARPAKLRDVSRIPGSISPEEFKAQREAHKGKTVVTSCTIGFKVQQPQTNRGEAAYRKAKREQSRRTERTNESIECETAKAT
mmetsp:Transcript_5792/g.14984  ORF Transcript_5792/g.14984 Transcript_5792/m.14984 type:complete len:150 (-) Transcript_5792:69-518(-)